MHNVDAANDASVDASRIDSTNRDAATTDTSTPGSRDLAAEARVLENDRIRAQGMLTGCGVATSMWFDEPAFPFEPVAGLDPIFETDALLTAARTATSCDELYRAVGWTPAVGTSVCNASHCQGTTRVLCNFNRVLATQACAAGTQCTISGETSFCSSGPLTTASRCEGSTAIYPRPSGHAVREDCATLGYTCVVSTSNTGTTRASCYNGNYRWQLPAASQRCGQFSIACDGNVIRICEDASPSGSGYFEYAYDCASVGATCETRSHSIWPYCAPAGVPTPLGCNGSIATFPFAPHAVNLNIEPFAPDPGQLQLRRSFDCASVGLRCVVVNRTIRAPGTTAESAAGGSCVP